ncbi:MAG: hypothetical protein ACW99A_18540 [Candidatus Kariarchaeaceae archaeon]|jgi:carbonic anhydrase/acetyltransferase-like protein (isoleucine patch superfamily)
MFSQKAFPHLPKDLIADSSARFIASVYIKEACEIGENCVIDGSHFRITINENCKIGRNTKVIAEVDDIEIGPNAVIGENCMISTSIPKNAVIADNESILNSYN